MADEFDDFVTILPGTYRIKLMKRQERHTGRWLMKDG
jgi:hypothetical protein